MNINELKNAIKEYKDGGGEMQNALSFGLTDDKIEIKFEEDYNMCVLQYSGSSNMLEDLFNLCDNAIDYYIDVIIDYINHYF